MENFISQIQKGEDRLEEGYQRLPGSAVRIFEREAVRTRGEQPEQVAGEDAMSEWSVIWRNGEFGDHRAKPGVLRVAKDVLRHKSA